ncbi:hypothetical protein AYI68_g2684 [Smittium mucronatum]|uniref:Uncharacterized protein n=1 Tax=Smittium mucronatum TaxID=133383 RepID=A0A1R0H251_9FUNG|nr:hypothetical protein AYI68_g2684 [Smittium mucronatum]
MLGNVELTIISPDLESDSPNNTENQKEKGENNAYNPDIGVCNMVSGYYRSVYTEKDSNISIKDITEPQKLQIPTKNQQELFFSNLENQRNTLKAQGFKESSVNIMFNSERSVKRKT